MTQNAAPTQSTGGQIAPLANIGVMEQAIYRLSGRGPNDPGMMVVSGPSGYGKSVAAAWAKARHRAYYLQLDDYVTKKSLLVSLCKVLGLVAGGKVPKGATWQLIDIVAAELHASRRPLIIDEFDFIVDKAMVMAVFSLYEKSRASIILVGEEAMPAKLARWEKFDGRVLDTLYAEAVGLEDARILARHKHPDFPIADDLLAHLVSLAKGSVRRVNNNLGIIHGTAMGEGWEACDLATWGDRPLQVAGVKRRGL
jgi:hypothetical protein